VPQTTLGELTALPTPLAGFNGSTSKVWGGEEMGGKGRRGKEGKVVEGEGEGREGRKCRVPPPTFE